MTTDDKPHLYVTADSAQHAHRLAKEQRTDEAMEHVDAIDRLAAAIRNAVGAAQEETRPAALRRVLTPGEYNRAWHALEGAAGDPDADPSTMLAAVLRALDIQANERP
ncbi:hypothetical protein QIS99_30330 [Streptomyces sp. B-S-A8]|uniref:Uncharacterized protein n=1 Tax=Streptomyces solicavernae TaxID=3043614 RepID=A0ABT6S371_9ACTN|nr:hypothetical protein [Streptomyces sp. B-S-A8]MDI3390458.1 hypothetical protein [Streptomyces sp. B-S-A8]